MLLVRSLLHFIVCLKIGLKLMDIDGVMIHDALGTTPPART
jgi:hypothetical protein